MPRTALYDRDQIIDATLRLVGTGGPAAATMSAISQSLRIPTGSIYHRFRSRDVLLGEVWLRAAENFQQAYFCRLSARNAWQAGLETALYLPARVRERLDEARILLLYRREDFLDGSWPRSMNERADALRNQSEKGFGDFAQRLLGSSDAESVQRVTYAVLHAPFAATRPHVQINKPPPPAVDALIRQTYLAIVERPAADAPRQSG